MQIIQIPEAKDVTLYFNGPGKESGNLHVEEVEEKGKETLIDDVTFSGKDLALEDSSPHRLIYMSPPLESELHISGLVQVKLNVSSSKEAANLSVWVLSLPWSEKLFSKITDNVITRGWADPQNHASLTESEELVPGKNYDLIFTLQPDDQVIKKGQQLAVMIFSSDRQFTLWPKPGTELTLDLDKSSITIPIVGGKEVYTAATGNN